MLKILVGLIQPTSGTVWYGDTNFTALNTKQRKAIRTEMGMLFQGSALFDSMTVEENVRFPLDMFTKMPMSDKKDRVNEVLKRVNLVNANAKYPSQLSGGMQKRVALARAIIANPDLIFFDEPTTGLDPITADAVNNLIVEQVKALGAAAITITHDMASVRKIALDPGCSGIHGV